MISTSRTAAVARLTLVAAALLLAGVSRAQQGAPATSQEKPDAPHAKQTGESKEPSENKRILGILPSSLSTEVQPGRFKPLTAGEKYELAFRNMYEPTAHLRIIAVQAINQGMDNAPHYGQGWGAYGQRIGAGEADNVVFNFFRTGLLPHAFKQDPRYFRKGEGKVASRGFYALTRTLIAKSDDGRSVFNVSNVVGALLQQGIANAYYPAEDRNAARTFRGWGISVAATGGYNVVREFYPDIIAKVFHRAQGRRHSTVDSTQP